MPTMPSKTKVQLREEAEEAKRDLRVFQEEATAQIKALQASERTLKAEMEELRELLGDLPAPTQGEDHTVGNGRDSSSRATVRLERNEVRE